MMKPSHLMEYNSGGAKPLILVKCKINLINVATRPGHIVLRYSIGLALKYTLRSKMYTLYSMTAIGFPNYSINKAGQVYSHFYNRFLKNGHDINGYVTIALVYDCGKRGPVKVHRLLAMMFIPNPENKEQVNHINGIKDDNRLENLEWVTQIENGLHAIRTGLYPQNQIQIDTAHLICKRLEKGIDVRTISNELGIPYGAISSIQLRKSWEHVSCQYNLPQIKFKGRELTESEIFVVQQLVKKHFTQANIAILLDVSESRVNMIRHKLLYGKE